MDVAVRGPLLQRAPDPADVDVYGARETDAGVSPDLLGRPPRVFEFPRGGGERRQELELLEAQTKGPPPDASREVLGVEPEVAGLEDLAAPAGRAPLEVGVYAGG